MAGRDSSDEMQATQPSSDVELANTLYGELRKVAVGKMAREYSPQTLQATALVHEAWLRIGGEDQPQWANRAQFFSAAAEAMRRILVDRARSKKAIRHGGGLKRVSLDETVFQKRGIEEPELSNEAVLGLNEALEELARADPEVAELIKLHYFAGLSTPELARLKGLTVRTAERRLAYGRAWLAREIERDSSG